MTNKEKQILKIIKKTEDKIYPADVTTSFLHGALQDIKKLLQPEPEKQRFVKGSIVKVESTNKKEIRLGIIEDEIIYFNLNREYKNDYIKTEIYNMQLLDFPTLARTIAQHIPEARKAILFRQGGICFENKLGRFCKFFDEDNNAIMIEIPYQNPTGERQKIDIEWED